MSRTLTYRATSRVTGRVTGRARAPLTWLLTWLLTTLLALLPTVGAFQSALAAPAAQADTAALLLGQYVFDQVAPGEARSYRVPIAEAGVYLITALDEDDAAAYDLVVTTEAGEELVNDVFGTTELTLEPGAIILDFFAVDEAPLEFVVLGQVGAFSADSTTPGRIAPGGVVSEEQVSSARYATLSIPATTYPQLVVINLQVSEEDIFIASAEGSDIGYVSTTTDVSTNLQFWTHGGDYLITLEPFERRSIYTLITFIGGPPPAINIDEPVEGGIGAGSTDSVYALNLDTNYDALNISLESDVEGLEIRFVDNLYAGQVSESNFGGDPVLEVTNVLPGPYYIFVTAPEPAAEDISFTLTASGSAGVPIPALESGVPGSGEFVEDEEVTEIYYQFEVTQPGVIISLALSGAPDDTDFDLSAGFRSGEGIWTSYEFGSEDVLTFLAPIAGTYYVWVRSNDYTGPFELTFTEGDLAPELSANSTIWGAIEADEEAFYRLVVPEGGMFFTVILIGASDDDLDLRVTSYTSEGSTLTYLSSYNSGSAEIVADLLEQPGIYEVVVDGTWSSGTNYFLTTRLEDPNRMAGQWAIDAVATSQYGEDSWSALQTTGEPNTAGGSDAVTAWAAETADGEVETLELLYEFPVVPHAVNIYESLNPGAVTLIEAYDLENEEWVVIWEGEAAAPEDGETLSRIFSPEFEPVGFATDGLRLTIDEPAVPGWNEIDAVELVGRP